MGRVRGFFGFSFSEIETLLLARLRELLGEGLEQMLRHLDEGGTPSSKPLRTLGSSVMPASRACTT